MNNIENMENIEEYSFDQNKIEEAIGYVFNNKHILKQAFTHSSYAYEKKLDSLNSNERIEFLGDAVLQIFISDYLYEKYLKKDEGDLTKLRASIVCEPSLAILARHIGLGEFLILGRGEEKSGGRDRDSTLADTYESVIGSIYIDGGMKAAQTFLTEKLLPNINLLTNNAQVVDYKTRLQEAIQKTSKTPLRYETIGQTGPDHRKIFTVKLSHNGKILGKGTGKSKKDAEQAAAKVALEFLHKNKK